MVWQTPAPHHTNPRRPLPARAQAPHLPATRATPTPAAPPVPTDHQPTPERDSDDLTGDAPQTARASATQVAPRWPTRVWGRTRHRQDNRAATTAAPLP